MRQLSLSVRITLRSPFPPQSALVREPAKRPLPSIPLESPPSRRAPSRPPSWARNGAILTYFGTRRKSFSVSPSSVPGGANATRVIYLDAHAPTGRWPVTFPAAARSGLRTCHRNRARRHEIFAGSSHHHLEMECFRNSQRVLGRQHAEQLRSRFHHLLPLASASSLRGQRRDASHRYGLCPLSRVQFRNPSGTAELEQSVATVPATVTIADGRSRSPRSA